MARRAAELDKFAAEIDVAGSKARTFAGDVKAEAFAQALFEFAET